MSKDIRFTTNCLDSRTGKVGCFLFSAKESDRTGVFKSTTPVFKHLAPMFDYAHANNISYCYKSYNFPEEIEGGLKHIII